MSQAEARIGRQVRSAMIREMKKDLSGAQTLVVFQTQNVPARDINALRRSLQQMDGNLLMVKNTLAALTFQELGWKDLEKQLAGTCGVAPVRGEVTAAAKLLAGFSKDHEGFVLRGGVLGGSFVTGEEIKALSRLPSREVLLSRLAGMVQSPLRRLAFALQGPIRSAALVLEALKRKKESSS